MKNLRKITLLTATVIFSISFSARAESSDSKNVTNNNSSEMIMNLSPSTAESIIIFQMPAFNLLVDINELTAENDLLLEEALELEEWMLDYKWVEVEESIIEEEMELEEWMLDYEWIEAEESVIEEEMELEEWMLNYEWGETEESLNEEEMELEAWMERPQNWSMYEYNSTI